MKTTQPKSILCFAVYPELGPSVRHRIFAYQALFEQHDVRLHVHSLISNRLYLNRRKPGVLGLVYKSSLLLFAMIKLVIAILLSKRYDVIIIHREAFPLGPPFFETLLCKLNSKVVFDIDDAIWHPPSFDVNQRQFWWDERRVEKIMRAVNGVVVGNEYLARYARQFNDRVLIIPTTYQNDFSAIESDIQVRRNDSEIKILWIGGLGNAEYLTPILNVVKALSENHPVRLVVVGGEDIHDLDIDQSICSKHIWSKEIEQQVLRQCHIGVMPLVNKEFELGKCAFKLVQYFSAALPVVASPVGMNLDVVEKNKNGFLADSQSEWLESLNTLVTDRAMREKMGLDAYHIYRQSFCPQAQIGHWLNMVKV